MSEYKVESDGHGTLFIRSMEGPTLLKGGHHLGDELYRAAAILNECKRMVDQATTKEQVVFKEAQP